MTSHKDVWILHIETSTKACSVALSKNEECIGYKEFIGQSFSHAEKLPNFIDEIISESPIQKNDLSALSISSGPGSYTGLRIGCSTAKGLSFALNIPLISVDTLQLSTKGVGLSSEQSCYISVMKARLNEVFIAIYDRNGVVKPTYYTDITTDEFNAYKETSVLIVGNAAHLMEEHRAYENWSFNHTENAYRASDMISLAYQKYKQKDFEDLAYYEPFYLKDFVVLKKKVKPKL